MSGLFVTGTDTEIGKTFVSTLLIRLLVEQGLTVSGMKPIASGAEIHQGVLKNEDALSLIAASNVSVDYGMVNPYVFEPAVSPHIAAEEAQVEIKFDVIKEHFQHLEKNSDVVIVEGVGGWHAPLSSDTTISDFAALFNLPVILVVGLRLGCLSHALLTAQAIRQAGVPIAGWVANQVDKNFSYVEKNIETLKDHLYDFPFIGNIPFLAENISVNKYSDDIKDKKNLFKHLYKEVLMHSIQITK